MKLKTYLMLALLCAVAQGVWAQTPVSSEQELKDAITDGATIQLTADILLENYLNIEGVTVTIDLNGHKLYRNLSSSSDAGHVMWVHNNGNLTIADNSVAHSGSIEGGKATNGGGINVWPGCSLTVTGGIFKNNSASNNGGAIFARNGANVTISNASFIGNSARDHAGAIWNNGTFTATDCTFENNRAKDVGGIYNSVTETDGTTYAGAATLTSCTFTGNAGTAGAGALANALGATVMTIEDCTIKNNTADTYGAGIWNGGTLNMKGKITVQDNTNVGGMVSNLYLKNGKVITVTGALTGSSIGVEMESTSGTFTSGYNTHLNGIDPSTIFTADRSSIVNLGLASNGEASLTSIGSVYYIERSWDETNKKVVNTEKSLTGIMIGYDATPVEGQYKEVTSADDDEWFGMGGYSDNVAEYYVVRGNVKRQTIVVQGKNVHLILCNGATLTLTGGLKLEGNFKLYIHSQSYGGDMGRLMVTNSYENAAGIGSARHNGDAVKVGELVIQGGHIEATGGKYGAGIGSCSVDTFEEMQLDCGKVTVYGGYVKANGGKQAAGIGGGNNVHGGAFFLYDGTVTATGGEGDAIIYGGAGVGGGTSASGGNVTIYGGTLTASGGWGAAGIGSTHIAIDQFTNQGGTFSIYGGNVTAKGGNYGAGIGGGHSSAGAEVFVYGGTVTANGRSGGAGIGGGYGGDGGNVTITGGKVTAKTNLTATAIGSGYKVMQVVSDYGTLTLGDAMMVCAGDEDSEARLYNTDERKRACWFYSYAEISPCTHPSGTTYTINEDGTHTSHCKHCGVSETAAHFNNDGTDPSHCKHRGMSETAAHFNSDNTGTCICGYKDGEDYCTITIATSSDGTSYEGVGITVNVGNNMPYTLPVCTNIPEGYDFAGWVVAPTSQANGLLPNEGETLLAANSEYTVTASVSIFARYKDLTISLADDSDNGETLYTYDGRKAASITLTGRTLRKDGDWNTLCLPFNVTIAGSPLDGDGVDVRTLASSSFDESNGTLTLTFTSKGEVTEIEAGTPYIIKWDGDQSSENIVGPTFQGVTISNTYNPVETDVIDFVGTYAPVSFDEEGDNTVLCFGADNTLYCPSGAMTIGAQRAFFMLNGLTAGEPTSTESGQQTIKAFNLNFGEELTGIREMENVRGKMDDAWYSIDGYRLIAKPSTKGLYIHNGVKVLIK